MTTNEKPLAPKDASPSAHLWLAALVLPALILAITGFQAPSLYDGRIETDAIAASETEPVPLWSDTGKRVWFTTADLLHPEDFGADGPRIDTVVVNLWPRGSPQWNAQTWLLQIRKLLDMRSANGKKIPGLSPTNEDLSLKANFVEFLRDGTGPEFERPVLFPISPNSTVHQRTGLSALVFTAVPAPGERDAAVALERALLAASARAAEVGATGIGISCSSSTTGSRSCGADGWSALLDAIYALPQNGISTIVIGGWALTSRARVEKARAFGIAWDEWQHGSLANDAGRITHEATRLAVLALAGAFIAAWARGLPFSALRLIGITLLSGGAVGAATNLAGAYVPLWNALAPDAPFDLLLKAIAALVIGLGLHLVVSFKPKEAVKPEQE